MKSRFSFMLGLTLAGILTMQTAKADIIGNFDDLNFDAPSVAGNGQFDAPASITTDLTGLYGGTSGSIIYNLTGLDITGDSSANDTATFTINVSAAGGGNLADVGAAGSQIGITGLGASGISDPSEVLTFSFGSGSVTLGDPGTGGAFNFIGFRNLSLNGFGNTDPQESVIIGGGTPADGTYLAPDQSAFNSNNALANALAFTVGGGTVDDNFSVQSLGARIQFQGTAIVVPEPSSLALVSVASAGLLARRRKRQS